MSGIQITSEDTGKPELLAWIRSGGLDPVRITMRRDFLPEVWGRTLIYGYVPPGPLGGDLIDVLHGQVFVLPSSAEIAEPLPEGIGVRIDAPQQAREHDCSGCMHDL